MSSHDAAITLCVAAAFGVFLIALADRLRVPSIALLLVGGIALGPVGLEWVDPRSLGAGLETVVTLAVAVILFEGGLTLDIAGFRREPTVIVRMLTVGVLVTWAGTATTVYLVFGVSLELAVIIGSLVIVTGPTVVSPILRRIGVQPRLHQILYWEGVLVDAVGVFVAVLCYEWINSSADDVVLAPLGRFASRFAVGAGIGLVTGLALGEILRRRWIAHQHTNIVVLASALLALGVANAVLHEAGILAVIIAGLVISLRQTPQLKQLKRFKLELTELGIGLLFILLAAKLELRHFLEDGARLLGMLAVVIFVLRPVNILLSTYGQRFSWREKAFLSWLAPRGIVAASMASLFAIRLENLGYAEAKYLETIAYAVIGATVIVQGLSAGRVARLLGLQRSSRGTWLLIGEPSVGVMLHRQLRQAGARSIVLSAGGGRGAVDPDPDPGDSVERIAVDPLAREGVLDPRLSEVEAVIALSRDPALNASLCRQWSSLVGPASCYRWGDPGDGDDGDDSGAAGQPIWRDIPPPGELAGDIEDSTYALEALEVGPPEDARRFGPGLRPLLAIDEGRISVVDERAAVTDAHAVIALRRRIPGLYGLVRDAIIVHGHSATFAEIVETLLDLAAHATEGLPVQRHLDEILDREKTMPTAVGAGLAIPHVYDDHCERSTCYVANIAGGLDIAGPDNEPVHLVFLVVSPSGKAQEHLRSLAAIAQLASETSLLQVLAEQRTRGRFMTLLRERE